MVRWIDGFYGGLIAGVTSAIVHALVSVAWLHDVSLSELFAQVAQALPWFHGAQPSWALVGLGVVLYLLLAVAFGIVYALLARRIGSMWRAPGSVVWGLCYGVLVWWAINDVLVPVSGAVVIEPIWAGLVATVVFYGVVLSEATTMAIRRRRLDLPGPGVVL
ncbi:MAG TPA: hypothetical protein VHS78_19475 [Candidatus Elarobacter sp.]|jgi:hypothetical protein|nr:hypothetical protein [Candidatus Elarobacter sp.]